MDLGLVSAGAASGALSSFLVFAEVLVFFSFTAAGVVSGVVLEAVAFRDVLAAGALAGEVAALGAAADAFTLAAEAAFRDLGLASGAFTGGAAFFETLPAEAGEAFFFVSITFSFAMVFLDEAFCPFSSSF